MRGCSSLAPPPSQAAVIAYFLCSSASSPRSSPPAPPPSLPLLPPMSPRCAVRRQAGAETKPSAAGSHAAAAVGPALPRAPASAVGLRLAVVTDRVQLITAPVDRTSHHSRADRGRRAGRRSLTSDFYCHAACSESGTLLDDGWVRLLPPRWNSNVQGYYCLP